MIICGVDGGGTKTKITISDEKNIRDSIVIGPTAIDTVDINDALITICEGVESLLNKHKLTHVDSVFLGLGGIASQKDINYVNQYVKQSSFVRDDTIVQSGNDILNAYVASCNGRENITLIIGTGSVVYGQDEEGRTHRASGIHYLEGDYGSGYDIGSRILKRMSLAFDDRIEHSQITLDLLHQFSINSFHEIVAFFNEFGHNRSFVASLARMVCAYAEKKDTYALEVLQEGAKEIALGVIAVDKHLSLKNREIGIVGGLGNQPIYKTMITNHIIEYDKTFTIHSSEMDPAEGSISIARKQLI